MRLFVAIDIAPELAGHIARVQDDLKAVSPLRFVEPESIHLTLKFLGEVPDEKAPKVTAALAAVAFSGVKLSTTKLGTFPGVLWLGIKLNKELAQLQQDVARAVRPFTTHDPRAFAPHLTIARFGTLTIQERVTIDAALRETRIERKWKADAFVLYKSTLTSSGPVYMPIATFGKN